MISITTLVCIFAMYSSELHLSHEQQIAVLSEAQGAYDNAIQLQTSDPVASKEMFRRSANRYQLLVDDGVENGKLWYNLGNAQLQAGEIGEAIAAYRSSKMYIPSDGRLSTNLEYARTLVPNQIETKGAISILQRITFWHTALPTQVRLTIGIVFWFACWTILALRLFRVIPYFKSASITFACLALILGASVGADIAKQHEGAVTAKLLETGLSPTKLLVSNPFHTSQKKRPAISSGSF